jgi:hypothetical protein
VSKHMRVPGHCWHIVQTIIEVQNLLWKHEQIIEHADFSARLGQICIAETSRFYKERTEGLRNE